MQSYKLHLKIGKILHKKINYLIDTNRENEFKIIAVWQQ